MKSYDEIEAEAVKKSRVKKPKMKVSGKSVFVLARTAGKTKKK
jgi:hypothetical protein